MALNSGEEELKENMMFEVKPMVDLCWPCWDDNFQTFSSFLHLPLIGPPEIPRQTPHRCSRIWPHGNLIDRNKKIRENTSRAPGRSQPRICSVKVPLLLPILKIKKLRLARKKRAMLLTSTQE